MSRRLCVRIGRDDILGAGPSCSPAADRCSPEDVVAGDTGGVAVVDCVGVLFVVRLGEERRGVTIVGRLAGAGVAVAEGRDGTVGATVRAVDVGVDAVVLVCRDGPIVVVGVTVGRIMGGGVDVATVNGTACVGAGVGGLVGVRPDPGSACAPLSAAGRRSEGAAVVCRLFMSSSSAVSSSRIALLLS